MNFKLINLMPMNFKLINLMLMNFKLINLMSMNFKLINLMSMNFKLINLLSINFANKQISYFFPLKCFLSLMNLKLVVFFKASWCFLVLFGAIWCFFVFVKSKNKKIKTGLMTSFILLLKFILSRSFSKIINNNHQ